MHPLDPLFGTALVVRDGKTEREPIDLKVYTKFIIREFAFNTWYQADRVLKKHYETIFGIFDHRTTPETAKRPFLGQAALEGNTLGSDEGLILFLTDYERKGIEAHTKMSFEKYLTLSREQRLMVDKYCQTKTERIAAEAARVAAEQAKAAAELAMVNKQPQRVSPGARNGGPRPKPIT